MEETKRKKRITTRMVARVAIFGAITTILYVVPFLQFKLPSIFPSFLEFHFDEIPAFIASFAYGPTTGVMILLIRTMIKLPFTSTVCVGELADFLYSLAFILPAAIYYKKHRNLKGVCIGFFLGFICQIVVSGLCCGLFMIDFYLFLFKGLTAETLLQSCQAINPRITDIHFSLVLWGVVPFNALKNMIVIFVTFLTYKSLGSLI